MQEYVAIDHDIAMDSREGQRIAEALALGAGEPANAAQIANTLVATLQEIDAALSPIVGSRGVAALYKRSLYLVRPIHPWLGVLHEQVQSAVDTSELGSLLAQQARADAAAGGGALLQTFYELLTTLVGPSLTERLLRSVWAHLLSRPPAQDTSP